MAEAEGGLPQVLTIQLIACILTSSTQPSGSDSLGKNSGEDQRDKEGPSTARVPVDSVLAEPEAPARVCKKDLISI